MLREAGAGILLIGDTHPSFATKRDYIDSLPELKQAGIQAVDFELLPVNMQGQVDGFARLLRDPTASRDAIAQEHNKMVDQFLGVWSDPKDGRRMAEQLTDMVEQTIKAGLKVVCIEPTSEHPLQTNDGSDHFLHGLERLSKSDQTDFDKVWNSHAVPKEVAESKQRLLSSLRDSGWSEPDVRKFGGILDQIKSGYPPLNLAGLTLRRPEQNDHSYQDEQFETKYQAWREQSWLQIIKHQVSSGEKVAVFGGGRHFGYGTTETISGKLAESGIKSVAVMKTGGDISDIPPDPRAPRQPEQQHTQSATEAHLGTSRFAYRLDSRHPREADYVIHIPNEELSSQALKSINFR